MNKEDSKVLQNSLYILSAAIVIGILMFACDGKKEDTKQEVKEESLQIAKIGQYLLLDENGVYHSEICYLLGGEEGYAYSYKAIDMRSTLRTWDDWVEFIQNNRVCANCFDKYKLEEIKTTYDKQAKSDDPSGGMFD